MIHHSLTELIGSTPLLELHHIERAEGLSCRLLAKLEAFNPGGSVKDRVALGMIDTAEDEGRLLPGGTIIEPTSGNTGVGLAWIAAIRGYRAILTMPETMSLERRRLLAAYGAEIVLTPGADGMRGAIEKAEELHRGIENSFILSQFDNPVNPATHVLTTADELWRDTDGDIDAFVAGIGSAGTISGVGKGLKIHNPGIRIVGVEPASSPMITEGRAGAHAIQGIGANFIPRNYHAEFVDEVLTVTNADALAFCRRLSREEGLLSGISSGAAVAAAVALAKRPEYNDKTIVALLPDTGERYLSVFES